MNKIKTCLLVFCLSAGLFAEIIPFISPGVMWSWNFNHTPTIILKISVGYYNNNFAFNDKNQYNKYFANFSFGKRIVWNHKQNQPDYLFTEIESGILYNFIFYGIGLGTAYYKNHSNLLIAPKASLFTGDGLFLRSDFALYDHKVDTDLGGMIVLPICKYWIMSPIGPFYTGD
jgi:hypothetical protein